MDSGRPITPSSGTAITTAIAKPGREVDQAYSSSPANRSLSLIYLRGASRARSSNAPEHLALNSWDHRSRYRTAARHGLVLYPLVGYSQTTRQRLRRLPAELFFY